MCLGISPLDCRSFKSELSTTLHLFVGPFSTLSTIIDAKEVRFLSFNKGANESDTLNGFYNIMNTFSALVQQLRLDGNWMSAAKETSKTSEGVLLDFRTLVVGAEGTLQGHIDKDWQSLCPLLLLLRFYMSEAMVSALKTADKTMAKGKNGQTPRKQSWFGKRREKRKAGERSVVPVSLSSLWSPVTLLITMTEGGQ